MFPGKIAKSVPRPAEVAVASAWKQPARADASSEVASTARTPLSVSAAVTHWRCVSGFVHLGLLSLGRSSTELVVGRFLLGVTERD